MAPIHRAARRGDLSEVMRLVEEDPRVVHTPDAAGWLPLISAASEGDAGVVSFLLDHGARVDQPSQDRDYQERALTVACSRGRAQAVRVLLERRADPSLTDADGSNALMQAASGGWPEVVRCLLGHGGVDVDARNTYNRSTALSFACAHGRAEVVRLLLEANADLTLPGYHETIPYVEAREAGHWDCVAVLEVRE